MQSEGNDWAWNGRGDPQAPLVRGRTIWLREVSRNINQGLIIPMASHGCVMVTPSIVRVSLNIYEDLTKMVVDWLGTAAMFLDMKYRAARSEDACTWTSVCGMLGSFSLSLTGIQIRNDSIKLNSNCLWLCQLTTSPSCKCIIYTK